MPLEGAFARAGCCASPGSWPSVAAMLGFTLNSDSFFGPFSSSAFACVHYSKPEHPAWLHILPLHKQPGSECCPGC